MNIMKLFRDGDKRLNLNNLVDVIDPNKVFAYIVSERDYITLDRSLHLVDNVRCEYPMGITPYMLGSQIIIKKRGDLEAILNDCCSTCNQPIHNNVN